jgi:glycosyltransferase involved in cell wall biosynthesis
MRKKIVLVGFKFKHHKKFSGYQRLVNYVDHDLYINRDSFDFSLQIFDFPLLSRINLFLIKVRDYFFLRAIKKVAEDQDCGLIHFLYPENSLAFIGFEIPENITVIATFHQPMPYFRKLVEAGESGEKVLKNFNRCDRAIVLSKGMERDLGKVLQIPEIKFIPHGVDTVAFSDLGWTRKSKSILILGTWLRDFSSLTSILKAIHKKDAAVSFTIISEPKNKAYFQSLPNTGFLHGLSHKRLVEELNTHAFLLLNFRDLVASNALLEAASCGLPIICNEQEALHDYFESGGIYTLPPTSDTCPEKLSEEIIALIRNKEKLKNLSIQLKNNAFALDYNQIGRKTSLFYANW